MLSRVAQRLCSAGQIYHWFIIIAVGIAIYANAINTPFIFDDLAFIKNNKAIAAYFDSSVPDSAKYAGLLPDAINSMDARKVVYFTFALNHLVHGYNVTGYNIVNILIHLAAALAVYSLTAALLKTPYFVNHPFDPLLQRALPLVTALLFVSHPIQTLAVTYTIQRFTSLTTLFYLLAILLYLKARMAGSTTGQIAFLAASVTVASLGMLSKQIAFTIPVITLVCEILFFRERWRKRFLFLLPLLCTMLIIPLNMLSQIDAAGDISEVIDNSVNLSNLDDLSQKDYLLTQFRVIITYLRLLALPVNQHLDYDYPLYHSLLEPPVALSALFLLAIAFSAIWAYHKSQASSPTAGLLRLYSFGIAWFFITISISSSIIPLSDVIFEYRLYLPSSGFFIATFALVSLGCQKLERSGLAINNTLAAFMLIILAAFCFATISRNNLFKNPVRFWEDNVAKAPLKKRPHKALAARYRQAGKLEKAISKKIMLITLNPDSPDNFKHWNDIAVDSVKIEKFDDALDAIRQAMTLRPEDPRLQATYDWILSYTGTKTPAPAR